jgi:phenylpropionate dioxygenase-like ring-hydroxylating dioxygenase large terminal subunit
MDRATEIALCKKLLHYVDTRTTALAAAPWENSVDAFASPERLAREQQTLFRDYPLLMGISSEWAVPGQYRTDDLAGVPILMVRGNDGTLRAFLNVCRHRGAKVADSCGATKLFRCPYHAWTYDLAGQLKAIPAEAAFANVRQSRASLTALPLCEKYGLVWVVPRPTADGATAFDIDPWLGGLGPELTSYRIDTYHHYDRRLVPENANWKILVDTFLEGYHIGFLHKDSLGSILYGNISDFEAFGNNARVILPRKKLARLREQPEAEWSLMRNTAIVYLMFPNTLIVPQGDHIEIQRIFPVDGRTDRAVMETGFYVPKRPTTEEEKLHWEKNFDLLVKVVSNEDFPTGRSMQIGFGSGAQTHIVYGQVEPGMIHYHQGLRRALSLPVETGAPKDR